MDTKFKKLSASAFTTASSSDYTMIKAPEGIGSLAGEDPHRGFSKFWTWQITIPTEDPAPPVPRPRSCSFFVGADDLARLEIGNGNIAELLPRGPQGGGTYAENHGSCMLMPGVYNVSLSYDNIDYDPAKNNAAALAFGISYESNPTYPEKALPDDNTPISTPKPCPCNHCSSNNQGGKNEDVTKSPKSKSSAPLCSTYASSSAGSENIAFADDNNMYWSCNFGCFQGMGSLPQGNLEILAYQMNPHCYQINGLNYSHPLHTQLLLPSGGIENLPNALLSLQNGERKDHYLVQGDGISICKVGTSSLSNNHVLFLDIDFQPLNHTNSSNIPCYLQVTNPDKSSCLYSLSTGSLSHYISPTQIRHSREQLEEDLQIIKQNDGSLYQIWNRWDGLAQVQDISDTGYNLALYLPNQVRDKDPITGYYSSIGEPFKQYRITQDSERQGFSISEEAAGHSPFRHTWWQQGEAWCMSQGEGDEAIITQREKTILPDSQEWELITSISQGNNTVSITAERYKNSTEGNLLLCKTEAYDSPDAQITYYEYDGQGLLTREIRPDEARYEYAYDHYGRIRKIFTPVAGSDYKIINTSYAKAQSYDLDPASITVSYVKKGKVTLIQRTDYIYSEANDIRRIEERSTAYGSNKTQFNVTETNLASAPNPHARERIHYKRDIDGTRWLYDYEATNEYGALYKVIETKRAAEPILGKSTREITYISDQGNTTRSETQALLLDGSWVLLDAIDYQYDSQNRWIKQSHANGRILERSMMCCGPLWEKDSHGIQSTYSYNSARQLIEIIRSETPTSPETITSYTRDAAGRILSTRIDTGAMSSMSSMSYNLLGRPTLETDVFGCTTRSSYSPDGLTITQILPTGASLITQNHADGNLLKQSGTAQQKLNYHYDILSDSIRTSISTPNPETPSQETILSSSDSNGFGQIIRNNTANTQGGTTSHKTSYNENAQITQEQIDQQAPLLYEYDEFGNRSKEILKLANHPNPQNSPITLTSQHFEQLNDGVYLKTTQTSYDAEGRAITSSIAQLISQLNTSLESKTISTDPQGNITEEWTEYGNTATARTHKLKVPSSTLVAEQSIIDGFICTQTNLDGTQSTHTRQYTEYGITLTQTDVRGNTSTTQQDPYGRIIKETDTEGNSFQYRYDSITAKIACITNPQGANIQYKYDSKTRLIAQYGSATAPMSYSYDESNRLLNHISYRVKNESIDSDPTSRTDGDVTSYSYHSATGLLLHKTYPDATQESYTYDSLNRPSTHSQSRLNAEYAPICSHYIYAPLTNQLSEITHNDNTAATHYTYNHLGMPISVSDASGSRSYRYNQYKQLIAETTQGIVTSQLNYKYDTLGRNTGYTLTHNNKTLQDININYDTYGRILECHSNNVATPFIYGYNPTSGVSKTISYPNTLTRWNTYEEKRNLITKLDYLRPGSANYPAKTDYTYDSLGRPTTKKSYFNTAQPELTHNYTYDNKSQLLTNNMSNGKNDIYSYDNIGNRKSNSDASQSHAYNTNPLNQYTEITQATSPSFIPTYDLDGNQTSLLTQTGEWQINYNALNQAILFSQGSKHIECSYDYLGRRIQKTSYEGEQLLSKKQYIYKEYLQIAELDATNASDTSPALPSKSYLWDPAQPIATRVLMMSLYDQNGNYVENLYYSHDAQKNSTALFGIQCGRRALYHYSPYGKTLKQDGNAANLNPFRYSSEYHDDETTLIYYNYRYYNPEAARFINRDPIGEQAGLNRYAFVNNNPVTQMDFLGLKKYKEVPIPDRGKNTSNCPQNFYVVVGGALDFVNRFARNGVYNSPSLPEPKAYYYYDSGPKITQALNKYRDCCPKTNFILIGHSYGGSTVMDLIENINKTQGKLFAITLDPVGQFNLGDIFNPRDQKLDLWINAYIKKGLGGLASGVPLAGGLYGIATGGIDMAFRDRDFNDFIAQMGGHWGYESNADYNLSFNPSSGVHHGDAGMLYNTTEPDLYYAKNKQAIIYKGDTAKSILERHLKKN